MVTFSSAGGKVNGIFWNFKNICTAFSGLFKKLPGFFSRCVQTGRISPFIEGFFQSVF